MTTTWQIGRTWTGPTGPATEVGKRDAMWDDLCKYLLHIVIYLVVLLQHEHADALTGRYGVTVSS